MTTYEYRQCKAAAKRRENVSFIKRTILTFSVITLIVLGMTFGCTLRANAKESTSAMDFKYYKEVQVNTGDSLMSIANDNMDETHYTSVGELAREIIVTNQLVSETITTDMVLLIPYYEDIAK